MNQLTVPQGCFTLNRYPLRNKETLRVWDSADEYLLYFIGNSPQSIKRLLIINDSFGALAVALYDCSPIKSHQGGRAKIHCSKLHDLDTVLSFKIIYLSQSVINIGYIMLSSPKICCMQ